MLHIGVGTGGRGGRGALGPPNIADCHVAVYITFGPPKMEMVPTPMLQTVWAQGYKYSSTCLSSPHCMSLE